MKKIIIIGAGIAGLAAGIYGRMNGFETEIYELHSIPGGECTGWRRGDYHFDGCIHWMVGTKRGTNLNKLWYETGALDDSVEIVNNEIFSRFEDGDQAVNIYRDINLLEKHLLELSPEDEPLIKDMCKAVRAFSGMEIPMRKPLDKISILEIIPMMPKMFSVGPYMKKYDNMNIKEFAMSFKSPFLQKVFISMMPWQYRASSFIMTLGSLSAGDSGWPMGGSLEVAKRMEKKYLSLGGKVFYKSKVEKIIVNEGKAAGIKLANGDTVAADYVISAADGYNTLYGMLDGKYLDEKIKDLYTDGRTYPLYTTLQVSIGVACDLSKHPHLVIYKTGNKVDAGGLKHDRIPLRHYCYDKSIAPPGKSVVVSILDADFDWWNEKYKDPEAYKQEKLRAANEVCAVLEERYPETKGKIERVDVATPMTYVRYCNAWRGAWMSWMNTPKNNVKYMSGKLQGVEGFYMAGQWTMPPGGLPGASMAGRFVIQRICMGEGSKFVTSK